MATASIFLLILWVTAHGLISVVALRLSGARAALLASAFMLIMVFLLKPYTYDLNKYSIYLTTGYIETLGWKTTDGQFQLYEKDTTGDPFTGGFEYGFRKLAQVAHQLLPSGALIPRIDPDYGDFKERGPPRADAALFFIAIVGFAVLLLGVGRFGQQQQISGASENARWLLVAVMILGSIFFVLGSQNALRQFIGFSVVLNAMALANSRKYILALIVLAASGLFHRWAPILGSVSVGITLLSGMTLERRLLPTIRPLRLSSSDQLMLVFGCLAAIGIKIAAVSGLFNLDIPFVEDLKPYLIHEEGHSALERFGAIKKAAVIGLLFLVSEVLIGESREVEFNRFRMIRRMSFLLIIPLSVYSEIFSRCLVIYWLAELLFIIWALGSSQTRVRLAGALVFLAYGIAPNAVNIIVGPNWLYGF